MRRTLSSTVPAFWMEYTQARVQRTNDQNSSTAHEIDLGGHHADNGNDKIYQDEALRTQHARENTLTAPVL